MGWTLERWRLAEFWEFMLAVEGYWRNWERTIVWPTRELMFTLILGNPDIKSESKPSSPRDLFKISDDKEEIAQREKMKPTPEEIEDARQRLIGIRDKMQKK